MAQRGVAEQLADDLLGAEILADMAHAAMGVELLAVIGDDPGGLLAAMLQRVQPEGDERGGIAMAVDAENPAFLAQMVVVVGIGGEHRFRHRVLGSKGGPLSDHRWGLRGKLSRSVPGFYT